jgi:serine protease Do
MSNQPFTRPRSHYLTAAGLVLAGLVIGLGLSAGLGLQRDSAAQQREQPAIAGRAGSLESPFVAVVERTLPAVVFIDVKKNASGKSVLPQDEMFRRLFGQEPPSRPRVEPSSGSGFLIGSEGHILTNNHVIANSEDITVTLNDKRTFKARVVGADPETDIAIIKIDGRDLPSLPLGDSDQLRIGDWAIAIGNPLGELRGSVTVGIISAQGRSNLNIFGGTPAYQDFIQTDASINSGNSGGPLCNIHGEAIGINTAINPSAQGISFAIPINLAKHVAEQLIASGKVKRAWMGVTLAELTPELADGFGIKGSRGVVVQGVLDGRPAARAGLQRNDVIVELNGAPVTDMQKFRFRVADMPVGSRIHLVVLREGRRLPITLTLAERTDEAVAGARPSGEEGTVPAPGGLRVRDLTSEEKTGTPAPSGVVVTVVESGSAAQESGLQEGDLIEEVGGKPVTSAAVFAKMLRDAQVAGKAIRVTFRWGSNEARCVTNPQGGGGRGPAAAARGPIAFAAAAHE